MSETFGQRIRELRRAKGISLRDLAERIGRDFTYLSKIETGHCLPPAVDVILALAAELGGDSDELAALGNKPPVSVLREQLAAATARIAELTAALEWYADEDNYECTPWSECLDGFSRIDRDLGQRARAALAAVQPAPAVLENHAYMACAAGGCSVPVPFIAEEYGMCHWPYGNGPYTGGPFCRIPESQHPQPAADEGA